MFRIFYDGNWIGSSDLETGDPPMGVAMGKFYPEPCYFEVQETFRKLSEEIQDHLKLTVIQPSGEVLDALATRIDDYPELGDADIQVSVIGIEAILYSKLFPGHWDAYNDSFKS